MLATTTPTSRPMAVLPPAAGRSAGTEPPPPATGVLRSSLSFDRGATIVREGSPATHWYEVVSGLARTCKLLADGRRSIGEFLLPGDVFGFELGSAHTVDVEAISPTAVVRLPLTWFGGSQNHVESAAARLHRIAFETVARNNGRLLLLARQTAHERVAGFVLEMDRRLPRKGSRIELPMTRQDVADYLCLTIETVCRTLSDLRRAGVIAVDAQHAILIRDRPGLEAAAGL